MMQFWLLVFYDRYMFWCFMLMQFECFLLNCVSEERDLTMAKLKDVSCKQCGCLKKISFICLSPLRIYKRLKLNCLS